MSLYEVITTISVLLPGRSKPDIVERRWTVRATSVKQAAAAVRNAGHGSAIRVEKVKGESYEQRI